MSGSAGSAGTAGVGGGGEVCGNGAIEGDEICDALPLYSEDCDTDCEPITSEDCLSCELAGACAPAVDCAAFFSDEEDIALCWEALDCFRDTGCAETSEYTCYCGTTAYDPCAAGTTPGNGVCKALIEEGLGTTDVPTIFNNFANPAFPSGLAMARISCDKATCAEACELD
jgi:hypothetical protein